MGNIFDWEHLFKLRTIPYVILPSSFLTFITNSDSCNVVSIGEDLIYKEFSGVLHQNKRQTVHTTTFIDQ